MALSQEDLGGHAAEESEGAGMAAEEGGQVLGGHRLGVEGAAEAKHHDEQVQGGRSAVQLVATELGPVDLGLQAGRRLEAHHRLPPPPAVGAREVLEDADPTDVALGADLLEERGGGQLGELGEAGHEVVLEGIELARCGGAPVGRRSIAAQRPADGVTADPEPARDRLDRDSLTVQSDDVHPLLHADQRHPPRSA